MTHNTAFSRQACTEEIQILPDGTIPQVEMTSCGLNKGPLKPEGTYPAAICCNLTNGRMPHLSNVKKNPPAPNVNQEEDTVFVKDIDDNTVIGYKYFDFQGCCKLSVITRGAEGMLAVCTDLEKDIENEAKFVLKAGQNWHESDELELNIQGVEPLYFVYRGKGRIDFKEFILKGKIV